MNDTAKELLTHIRAEVRPEKRNDAKCLAAELFTRQLLIRDQAIWARANMLWALYDETALQVEFDQRISPEGFNTGFSFDISDIDEENEPWAAAFQLAIDDWFAAPWVELPEATEEEIATWIAATPPPKVVRLNLTQNCSSTIIQSGLL